MINFHFLPQIPTTHICFEQYKWNLNRMKSTLAILVCAMLHLLVTADEHCPWTWFYHPQDRDQECVCGADLGGAVSCDNATHEVGILMSFCMTYDSNDNTTVAGKCIFPHKALFATRKRKFMSKFLKMSQNSKKCAFPSIAEEDYVDNAERTSICQLIPMISSVWSALPAF